MTYFPGGGAGGGIPPSEKGAPNGVATLDNQGKLVSVQADYIISDITGLQAELDSKATGSGTASGTNTGDQFTNMTSARLLGRITAGFGAAEELSGNQATTLLDVATGSAKGLMSVADFNKLAGIAAGATVNATDAQLRDRSTHTGSQAISTITGLQGALDGKQPAGNYEPAFAAGTTAQYRRGDKTWQTLDKAAVGLANVDNTSDANKPVSTAQATAIGLKLDASQKGVANGVASLGADGKVPAAQLPASQGGADPWTRAFLAADHVNATVAFTDAPGMSVVIPANTDFTIELDLLLAAIVTTNLPRVGINWNAALAWGEGELWYASSATAKVFANGLNLTAAGNLQMAAGTAPVVGVYGAGGRLKGRTGGASVTIKLQLAAESAAANAATMKAKSEFRSRQF